MRRWATGNAPGRGEDGSRDRPCAPGQFGSHLAGSPEAVALDQPLLVVPSLELAEGLDKLRDGGERVQGTIVLKVKPVNVDTIANLHSLSVDVQAVTLVAVPRISGWSRQWEA